MAKFVTRRQYRFGDTPRGAASIKAIRVSGKEPTFLLGLVAGVHGDELSSCVGLRRFLQKLIRQCRLEQLRGEILAMPLANPFALEQGRSEFQLRHIGDSSSVNLNRCFPGDPHGSLGERLAHKIFSIFKAEASTFVIDFHCTPSRAVPHIIIDRVSMSIHVSRMVWEVANSFGLGVVYDFSAEEYEGRGLQNSLSAALLNAGIPAFTVEVPGGSAPQDSAAWIVCNGLWNVVSEQGLGIVPGHPTYEAHESKFRLDVGKLKLFPGPRANAAGFFEPTTCALDSLANGRVTGFQPKMLREGEVIGEIWDGYGDVLEEILAPRECLIAYIVDGGPVSSGDELFCLLVPESS